MLTNYYQTPMHRVFEARALLYAQRMIAKYPKSAFALEHRHYALAMATYQRLALTALTQAESVHKKAHEQDPAKAPWADLLKHYCQAEVVSLKTPEDAPELNQWVHVPATHNAWRRQCILRS